MRAISVLLLMVVPSWACAAWFVCPYQPCESMSACRYCAMDDFTARLNAVGGSWSESECLGNHAVVKVTAPDSLLDKIRAAEGFVELPIEFLWQPLSGMPLMQQYVLIGKAQELGYSIEEIQTHFPNDLGTYTLRDMLNFILTRRYDPAWDEATQSIVFTSTARSCKSADALDAEVPDTLRYVGN
jgi:hypothetical protein